MIPKYVLKFIKTKRLKVLLVITADYVTRLIFPLVLTIKAGQIQRHLDAAKCYHDRRESHTEICPLISLQ